jgi:hypothetical protein
MFMFLAMLFCCSCVRSGVDECDCDCVCLCWSSLHLYDSLGTTLFYSSLLLFSSFKMLITLLYVVLFFIHLCMEFQHP